ncbi:hypothetical protein [Oricola cellulosilytica]|uniref:Glutamine amidotransferase domain-containing protein n=1 Tax=Oricola cellulosilytica TaxID=1429082 RepID=A0A4R0PEZ4_9HYPH|nr:hypothetical protein [Oricola cellulosilytica]TCD15353.1 hypothetical protein E0D97_07415 [Oricola cellulosilytica]
MVSLSIDFDPLVSWLALALACAPVAAFVLYALYARTRGSAVRAGAAVALALAIANPVVNEEERAPLKTIVPLIVDKSQSQRLGERTETAQSAVEILRDRLARFPQFEVREVEAGASVNGGSQTETRLFEALGTAIRDVPPSRLGGAIMITDGQIHDVPAGESALPPNIPLHALITGRENEFDRKVEFVRAPRFSIAGQPASLAYQVTDSDGDAAARPVSVQIFLNGDLVRTDATVTGAETPLELQLDRAGTNIIELAVGERPGELTTANNRAVAQMEGIRENLRVLLVSGEPHSGERTWRNLLKSDASVDLVHFTILRPPEKQDGTPINELSLIAFPTRELFVEKIEDFDLIIFDRYQYRNVLPTLYYDYIAQYVRGGGALLVAAGPEYAGENSIARTPLITALPATPTGGVIEQGYYPRISQEGQRHPVTRDLEGGQAEPPAWGRWFRAINVEKPDGIVAMYGPADEPLLVLNRFGEGRVGMLLSDHGWLWARGFEGGGPHVGLYRRIAHWLMKEPELEEEALTAVADGQTLTIRRQTMEEDVSAVLLRSPSGVETEITLEDNGNGIFQARIEADEVGLYEIVHGEFSTLAHAGPVDAPEFRSMISDTRIIAPAAEAGGGSVRRLLDSSGDLTVPGILPVRANTGASGRDWLGFRTTGETELLGVTRYSLFSGFLGLALLLLALGGTWYREGR